MRDINQQYTLRVLCTTPTIFIPFFLKGLAHADLPKNDFLHEFLPFYVRLLCSINFCFGSLEMRQFKNNCIGLKIDW